MRTPTPVLKHGRAGPERCAGRPETYCCATLDMPRSPSVPLYLSAKSRHEINRSWVPTKFKALHEPQALGHPGLSFPLARRFSGGSDSDLRGTFGKSADVFGCHSWEAVLLAASGERPAMLLTACQAQDGPPRQNYQASNTNSALAETCCPSRRGDMEEAPGPLFPRL